MYENAIYAKEVLDRVTKAAETVPVACALEKLADLIGANGDATVDVAELILLPSAKSKEAVELVVERAKLLAAFGQDYRAKAEYEDLEALEVYAEVR